MPQLHLQEIYELVRKGIFIDSCLTHVRRFRDLDNRDGIEPRIFEKAMVFWKTFGYAAQITAISDSEGLEPRDIEPLLDIPLGPYPRKRFFPKTYYEAADLEYVMRYPDHLPTQGLKFMGDMEQILTLEPSTIAAFRKLGGDIESPALDSLTPEMLVDRPDLVKLFWPPWHPAIKSHVANMVISPTLRGVEVAKTLTPGDWGIVWGATDIEGFRDEDSFERIVDMIKRDYSQTVFGAAAVRLYKISPRYFYRYVKKREAYFDLHGLRVFDPERLPIETILTRSEILEELDRDAD